MILTAKIHPKCIQNEAIWSPGLPKSDPRTQKMQWKWHPSAPCYAAGVELVGLARSAKNSISSPTHMRHGLNRVGGNPDAIYDFLFKFS